jgi:quinol monooxygenase YgiN
MITVIAIITAKRGQRASVLEAFRANAPTVKAVKGCIDYEGHVDSLPALKFQTEFGPDAFVVIENWENLEAFEAHSKSPHMVAYIARARDMIATRVIHVLSSI